MMDSKNSNRKIKISEIEDRPGAKYLKDLFGISAKDLSKLDVSDYVIRQLTSNLAISYYQSRRTFSKEDILSSVGENKRALLNLCQSYYKGIGSKANDLNYEQLSFMMSNAARLAVENGMSTEDVIKGVKGNEAERLESLKKVMNYSVQNLNTDGLNSDQLMALLNSNTRKIVNNKLANYQELANTPAHELGDVISGVNKLKPDQIKIINSQKNKLPITQLSKLEGVSNSKTKLLTSQPAFTLVTEHKVDISVLKDLSKSKMALFMSDTMMKTFSSLGFGRVAAFINAHKGKKDVEIMQEMAKTLAVTKGVSPEFVSKIADVKDINKLKLLVNFIANGDKGVINKIDPTFINKIPYSKAQLLLDGSYNKIYEKGVAISELAAVKTEALKALRQTEGIDLSKEDYQSLLKLPVSRIQTLLSDNAKTGYNSGLFALKDMAKFSEEKIASLTTSGAIQAYMTGKVKPDQLSMFSSDGIKALTSDKAIMELRNANDFATFLGNNLNKLDGNDRLVGEKFSIIGTSPIMMDLHNRGIVSANVIAQFSPEMIRALNNPEFNKAANEKGFEFSKYIGEKIQYMHDGHDRNIAEKHVALGLTNPQSLMGDNLVTAEQLLKFSPDGIIKITAKMASENKAFEDVLKDDRRSLSHTDKIVAEKMIKAMGHAKSNGRE